MIRALYSAASGMQAQEMNVDNIANNLANANTVGYKFRRAQFQDLMYQSVLQPGSASSQQTVTPAGLQLGLGARPTSNEIIFTQGAFSETDNPLDVVIQGNGFFQILQPNGELAYTRAGQFQLDKNGNIVNSSGFALQPQITIPADAQWATASTLRPTLRETPPRAFRADRKAWERCCRDTSNNPMFRSSPSLST
jgi:flagellar basal-body rod protein FlgG